MQHKRQKQELDLVAENWIETRSSAMQIMVLASIDGVMPSLYITKPYFQKTEALKEVGGKCGINPS